MKFMITCEETALQLSEKMDVSLSPAKRFLLQVHLMMCRKCADFGQQMKSLRDIFLGLEKASSQDQTGLPEESRKRIQQALLQ